MTRAALPVAALASAALMGGALLGGCAPRRDIGRVVVAGPVTRAESSGYTQTSTYGDVMAFINTLRAHNLPLAYGSIGTTTQGRAIPYIVASRPMVATPEEARRLGRPVVYVNANIHAGEVEGKEALLALVRDLSLERRANVLDSVVLIAVPDYNADGNEAFASERVNRTEQNGPERVGQRPNGQGYDLNRDYVKAEAPETRAALAMFDRWDPDVYVDLHTTDGSYHGFALTYSPSLNPAAYAPGMAGAFTRDTLLPEIRAQMARRGIPVFDYGNFDSVYEERDITDTVKRGWYTYDHRPRYGTNYFGLRGRVSILSEAYSHDPFRKRIASTYAFVREILSATARHHGRIMAMRDASIPVAPIPVQAQLTTHPLDAPIPFEVLADTGDSLVTQSGVPRGVRRTGRFRTQIMPVYDRFEASYTVPSARYLVPDEQVIIENLRQHGVITEPVSFHFPFHAQVFTVDSVEHSTRPFQGHRETRVAGRWRDTVLASVPSGMREVVDSPRTRAIAAYLLEPLSDDGLLDWNVLDRQLLPGRPYPVLRVLGTSSAGSNIHAP